MNSSQLFGLRDNSSKKKRPGMDALLTLEPTPERTTTVDEAVDEHTPLGQPSLPTLGELESWFSDTW